MAVTARVASHWLRRCRPPSSSLGQRFYRTLSSSTTSLSPIGAAAAAAAAGTSSSPLVGSAAAAGGWRQRRHFSGYEGQSVEDAELVKKSDDWAVEETNFCLGRVAGIRFKETDDLAHRVLHLMECQLPKMHTRLRDGTCIPFTGLYLSDVLDKPSPMHIFQEMPLLKWTWDETYDEAYADSSAEEGRPSA